MRIKVLDETKLSAFLASFVVAFLVGMLLLPKNLFLSRVFAQGQGNCAEPQADGKDEVGPDFGDDFDPDLPAGFIITEVFIKAGNNCFGPYTADGTYENDTNGPDSCYEINGIGTNDLSVERVGDGQALTCQEISHIEVNWNEEISPTPTEEPSPTPTEDPSPTPTEEPSPTPTEEPSPTPTEEPSATPTQEPSPTPTVEPSATPTEEPSATPTESTTPTLTPTESPTPTLTPTPSPSPTGTVASTSTTSDPGNSTQGTVLGATTLASTGNKAGLFMVILGIIFSGLGIYGLSAPKTFKRS